MRSGGEQQFEFLQEVNRVAETDFEGQQVERVERQRVKQVERCALVEAEQLMESTGRAAALANQCGRSKGLAERPGSDLLNFSRRSMATVALEEEGDEEAAGNSFPFDPRPPPSKGNCSLPLQVCWPLLKPPLLARSDRPLPSRSPSPTTRLPILLPPDKSELTGSTSSSTATAEELCCCLVSKSPPSSKDEGSQTSEEEKTEGSSSRELSALSL